MAIQIKLDELIRAGGAQNSMSDLECLSEEQLAALRVKFTGIADRARKDKQKIKVEENRINSERRLRQTKARLRPKASHARVDFCLALRGTDLPDRALY